MREFYRPFKLVTGTLFLASLPAKAVLSDRVVIPRGARVARFVGTFGPHHIRHDEHAQNALASDATDFVLVIPNDATVHKPMTLAIQHRLEMLQAAYQNHPRVIVPHSLTDLPFPISGSVKKYLDQKFPGIVWRGMMGKDSALSRVARFGALLQKPESWIVLTPDAGDESKIPNMIGGRPVIRVHSPTENDIRSSHIRKAAENGDLAELKKMLLPEVAELIYERGWYRSPERRARLPDYLKNCQQLVMRLMRR